MPYREAPKYTYAKPSWVCISRGVWILRSKIKSVLPDGTVIRYDGLKEVGDIARLTEEGLL